MQHVNETQQVRIKIDSEVNKIFMKIYKFSFSIKEYGHNELNTKKEVSMLNNLVLHCIALKFWCRCYFGAWFYTKNVGFLLYISSGSARIRFGGNVLGGRPRRGSGGLGPPDAGEFSKFFKKFRKKIANNAVF